MGLEFALGEPGQQFLQVLLAAPGISLRESAPEYPDDRTALEKWQIKGDAWNITGGKTNYQEAPTPGYAAQRPSE